MRATANQTKLQLLATKIKLIYTPKYIHSQKTNASDKMASHMLKKKKKKGAGGGHNLLKRKKTDQAVTAKLSSLKNHTN